MNHPRAAAAAGPPRRQRRTPVVPISALASLLALAAGCSAEAARDEAEGLRETGATVMFLAADETLIGLIAVADPIKTPEAIRELRAMGLRIIMLTGDSQGTAEAVGRELGLDQVIADALPDEKLRTVGKLPSAGRNVAMATGTDVAMESAAVTLVRGDLRGIVRPRRLSGATLHNIKTGWLLSPMVAPAAMSLSSDSVIANALRLRRSKVERAPTPESTRKARRHGMPATAPSPCVPPATGRDLES